MKTLIEQFISTPKGWRRFYQETLILECTELICGFLNKRGIDKAELAKRLGKTERYITRLLDGRVKMTLRTISDVMWAMDANLTLNANDLNTRS